ncbi:ornithine cyclodeaminase family protein [Macrococcus lamae]|uniref:Ornithine cyclodeaminase family protein n=1 Tax=Macrococcus lamae TaxID=198484 RepID=A0A4R6BUP1_9STAP|nr:ornithine cyclodeaminase family protein [Macrococcus lamae]TDM11958.1 ornithine cyclodeaminase family protein [Macrococcus lamae]
MKWFTEDAIMNTYHMTHAIKDVKNTLVSLGNEEIKTDERTVIETGSSNTMLYMPCVDLKEGYSLIKIISIFPENPQAELPTSQAVSIISELKTGRHLAALSSSYLTRLRTGAITGIATDYLAREDAEVLGVIGTGAMAFEQLLGVLEVRNIKKILLYNRTAQKATQFAARLRERGVKADIEVLEDVDSVTKQSDIINCATKSETAVFNHQAVRDGTHINGLGSYLPSMREITIDTIATADLIVLDDIEGARHEAGEFIEAESRAVFDWKTAIALYELIAGSIKRERAESITIFKSVGASYYDLAVGIGAFKQMS